MNEDCGLGLAIGCVLVGCGIMFALCNLPEIIHGPVPECKCEISSSEDPASEDN